MSHRGTLSHGTNPRRVPWDKPQEPGTNGTSGPNGTRGTDGTGVAKRTAAVDRVRRCRERARAGKAVLMVTVDLERARDVLIGAGLLKEWDSEDKRAIAAALENAIQHWMEREAREQGISR